MFMHECWYVYCIVLYERERYVAVADIARDSTSILLNSS